MWPCVHVALCQCGLVSASIRHVALCPCGLVYVWPCFCVALCLCGLVSVWSCVHVALCLCGLVSVWPCVMWPCGMWPSVVWPYVCEPSNGHCPLAPITEGSKMESENKPLLIWPSRTQFPKIILVPSLSLLFSPAHGFLCDF